LSLDGKYRPDIDSAVRKDVCPHLIVNSVAREAGGGSGNEVRAIYNPLGRIFNRPDILRTYSIDVMASLEINSRILQILWRKHLVWGTRKRRYSLS